MHARVTLSLSQEDGNWDAAARAAAARPADTLPWVVLVTGLNGIRKTTSVGQPWFKELLRQALGAQFEGNADELPAGTDSFFRQLDYMIATVALEQFKTLYTIGSDAGDGEELGNAEAMVGTYAAFKEAIFARYRTVAEILGVLLVKQCQTKRLNVMVETSGVTSACTNTWIHSSQAVKENAATANSSSTSPSTTSATPSARWIRACGWR